MPIVDPADHAETPIYQALLHERFGRSPGMLVGETDATENDYRRSMKVFESPTEKFMKRMKATQVVPLNRLRAVQQVFPIAPESGETTQSMRVIRLVKDS